MNSSAIIIVTTALLLTATASLVYPLISLGRTAREASKQRFKQLQFLFNKLERGQSITGSDVYDCAKNILTRQATFQLLQKWDLTAIFPEEFYTMEKAAESNLATWLEFPTELGICPDEINYLKKVAINLDDQINFFCYYVFRFRMKPPHWIANKGWMLGVVGPYFDNSQPYDHPNSTFSRFHNITDSNFAAEEEAKWVHEYISLPFVSDDAVIPYPSP